jgi:hypothetical protein
VGVARVILSYRLVGRKAGVVALISLVILQAAARCGLYSIVAKRYSGRTPTLRQSFSSSFLICETPISGGPNLPRVDCAASNDRPAKVPMENSFSVMNAALAILNN